MSHSFGQGHRRFLTACVLATAFAACTPTPSEGETPGTGGSSSGTGGSGSGGSSAGTGGTPTGTGGTQTPGTGGVTGTGGTSSPSTGGSTGTGGSPSSPDAAADSNSPATDAPTTPTPGGPFPPGPHKVVLITGDVRNLNDPSRVGMIEILKGMATSHNIVLEEIHANMVKASDMMGKALLIAGPNANYFSVTPDPELKNLPVPIIVSKDGNTTGYGIGTMRNTGAANLTTISIIKTDHPLAAGLPMGPVKVFNVGARFVRGEGVGPGAIKIATTPEGPGNSWGIFAYDKGGEMPGGLKAPAKRVGFFWHRPPGVTPEGRKLFEAAVAWAITP